MSAISDNPHLILALDVSTTNTGWCIGDGPDYIASGVFSPKGDLWTRIVAIGHEVKRLNFAYGPLAVVAFEEPQGNHGNMGTNIKLGYVNGVALGALLLSLDAPELLPVHIAQIKATGCHKRARPVAAAIAGKREVGEDEADAIGCWLAALGKLDASRAT